MDGGDDLKKTADRKDLWSRAMKRPDRHVERDAERDIRSPRRETRKMRSGGRK